MYKLTRARHSSALQTCNPASPGLVRSNLSRQLTLQLPVPLQAAFELCQPAHACGPVDQAVRRKSAMSSKWLVAILAAVFSALSNIVMFEFLLAGVFRTTFGALGYLYLLAVIALVAAATYVVVTRSESWLVSLSVPALAAYTASVLSYLILAFPSLTRAAESVGPLRILWALILPPHLVFAAAGMVATALTSMSLKAWASLLRT